MLSQMRRVAMTPAWVAQLATGAKSFEANLVIGNRRLNQWGLHAGRSLLPTGWRPPAAASSLN